MNLRFGRDDLMIFLKKEKSNSNRINEKTPPVCGGVLR